jgi:hypothetical protein
VYLRIRQRLDPHIAEAAVFLALLAICFPSLASADFWWHLRSGELIWANRAVPRNDPFTFTVAGHRWIAHEWLSEVLLYATYRFGGYAAVLALFGTLIAAAYWLAFRSAKADLLVGPPVLVLAVWAAHPTFLARPQIFTLCLFSVFCFVLEAHRRTGSWRTLLVLPALTLLWVNLHGGYILGPTLILLFLAGYALDAIIDVEARRNFPTRAKQVGLAGLACLAVVPLNPNGMRLYTYPFETLGSPVMQSVITEWQAPDPRQRLFFPLFLLVGLAALALALRRRTLRPGDILFVTFFAVAALHSMRHMALFSVACIPLLAGWRLPPIPWRIPLALRSGAIALLVLLSVWRWHSAAGDAALFERERFPAEAVTFLEHSHPSGQIFNSYAFGGYLIWRLYPDYRVYVDGRADLYGDTFLAHFKELYEGQVNPQPEFLRRDIRTVVVEPDAPIANLLRITRGWHKSYQDARAVIYERADGVPPA